MSTTDEMTLHACAFVRAIVPHLPCPIQSHILLIKNAMQDEKLITCCTADNVFKGSSWKYLLRSIVDNRVLQESGLAIHINDAALFYIMPWKDRDLETMWREFAYESRHQLDLFIYLF